MCPRRWRNSPDDREADPLSTHSQLFGLANADGNVVVPVGPLHAGQSVPDNMLDHCTPLKLDGQVIGTLIDPGGGRPGRNLDQQRYLEHIKQALIYASIGATLMAVILGIVLAATLTRSLRELTNAARLMAQGELEQAVPVRSKDELGKLAAAFNLMSREVAQANQQRRQMTADIAHDLRNPLLVLTGYIEAMRDGTLRVTPDRLAVMFEEAQHLQRLVADLRTLSLADAGELKLATQPVSPVSLLKHTAEVYRQQAVERGIALHIKAEESVPEVRVGPRTYGASLWQSGLQCPAPHPGRRRSRALRAVASRSGATHDTRYR